MRASAGTRSDAQAALAGARATARATSSASESSAVTVVAARRPGRAPPARCRRRGRARARARRCGELSPQRQVGVVGRALHVVPDAARGVALIPTTARPARGGPAGRAAPAARCRWGARTAARRRRPPTAASSDALQVAVDRELARPRRRTSGAAPSPRRACPSRSTRRTRPASSSKSASQIQETSRPSAIRSLSASQRSSRPSSSISVRSTSFAPAGFLTSRIEQLAAAHRDRLHAAEGAAEALERPRTTSPSGTPSSSAAAVAATAL